MQGNSVLKAVQMQVLNEELIPRSDRITPGIIINLLHIIHYESVCFCLAVLYKEKQVPGDAEPIDYPLCCSGNKPKFAVSVIT